MEKKNCNACKQQEKQCIKNAVPAWVSILAISIAAFIAGFVLMNV